MSIAPRRDHTGRIIGVAGATLDVTARNRALSASRQLGAIVASSEDAIISEDLNGIITSWNKSAERIFGYTAEEMIGQSISLLIPGVTHGEQPELLEKILAGEGISGLEISPQSAKMTSRSMSHQHLTVAKRNTTDRRRLKIDS